MSSRRVAILSVHTSPLARLGGRQAGGMNVYVRQLAAELARRGFAVDVFTRRHDASLPEVVALPDGARVVHLSAGPESASGGLTSSGLQRALPEFRQALLDFVARQGGDPYDVVHSHYWLSGIVGADLKGLWGVPHVTMFHTLGEVKNRARSTEREALRRIRAERRVAQSADRIVCASHHEKHLLERLYGVDADRVAVVPCGVDLDLFRPLDKAQARRELGLTNERVILFVGRIEPLKGIDILINAAAQLHEESVPKLHEKSDFAVMIVGGDASARGNLSALQALASGLGIDDHVSFMGAVDHEKLPLYYNAADVCVVPSYYESFGLVALEAMACGVPVIASRVGGLTGTVRDGETGYLISWRCPEPFAERLELLLGNDDLRRRMGEAAREYVERFRWSNVGEAVTSVYDELLAARPETQEAGVA